MKELKSEYLNVLLEEGWYLSNYTDDGRVEIGLFSPAGEDFFFCVDVENFQEAVAEYADEFDIDEYVWMWMQAKHNGVAGVPSVRELVCDAEDIDQMLKELAFELGKADRRLIHQAERRP